MSRVAGKVRLQTPIRQYCDARRGGTASECTVVAAAAPRPAGPLSLHSPAESLISNERYRNSPRIAADVVPLRGNWPGFKALNACFFEGMVRSKKRYGHAPRDALERVCDARTGVQCPSMTAG
ncbi:MAG: hypothetical protein AAF762_02250 [Pseudomonadota bacterium]